MGFFDDSEDAPPIQMNNLQATAVSSQFPSVNVAEIFDEVSNQHISFVRGIDSEKYLEIKTRYDKAKQDFDWTKENLWGREDLINKKQNTLENARKDLELARIEQKNETGLNSGEIRLSFKDLIGKPSVDSPININDVNTTLPPVQNLQAFNMLYAAGVANLSGILRNLSNTIETVINTSPELVASNQSLINSFTQAQKRALDRNFDIRKNGLDLELAKRGLLSSSTAIGAKIALFKERNDAQLKINLDKAQLAQGLKEGTLKNLYTLGEQITQEANIQLNKYGQESRNQLLAREQDQSQERLRQQQAVNQIQLNLAKNDQIINSELGKRQLRLAQESNRNLPNLLNSFVNTGNQQSLTASGLDAETNLGIQRNQLAKSNLELEKFKYENAAKPNLLGSSLGVFGGAALGGFGKIVGEGIGKSFFNKDDKNEK